MYISKIAIELYKNMIFIGFSEIKHEFISIEENLKISAAQLKIYDSSTLHHRSYTRTQADLLIDIQNRQNVIN